MIIDRKQTTKMNRLIDGRVKTAVEGQSSAFRKSQIVREVADGFEPMPKKKGLETGVLLQVYIQTRLDRVLQATKDGVRIFECYATGSGERRWQKLRSMNANQLRVCILARSKQIRGEELILQVYIDVLEEMERTNAASVADVIDDVLDRHDAAQAS